MAAICLVGINAIFSGGYCSQAVLQNEHAGEFPSQGCKGPSGEAAYPGQGTTEQTSVGAVRTITPALPGREPQASGCGPADWVLPPSQVIRRVSERETCWHGVPRVRGLRSLALAGAWNGIPGEQRRVLQTFRAYRPVPGPSPQPS